MGKLSQTKAPDLKGSFSISGGPSAFYNNGQSTYTLIAPQQKAYDYAQGSFADGLSSLNTFLPETVNNIYKQVDAYKNLAMDELNDLYTPLLRQTQNDAARRFGNLDNKVFLDNYGTVEKKRGQAISNLAQNVTAKANDLYQQEIQNRYNYLNFLNSYQNQVFQNALAASGQASSAANMYAQYQNQYNRANSNNILGLLGAVGGGALLGAIPDLAPAAGNAAKAALNLLPKLLRNL